MKNDVNIVKICLYRQEITGYLLLWIQKKGAGTFCMNYACTLISGKRIAY